MGENFRTLAQPVAFVNALFARFMHPVPGEPFQVGYDPLVGRRPAGDSPGSVELLLLPPEEDRDELDAVQREAELLARRIGHILTGDDLQVADKDGLRPPRPGDIAMLLRRRRNLFAYEYALRAHGIPFQVVGGRGFYQRQEIYDLANVLRVLHNARDAVALLGALPRLQLGLEGVEGVEDRVDSDPGTGAGDGLVLGLHSSAVGHLTAAACAPSSCRSASSSAPPPVTT